MALSVKSAEQDLGVKVLGDLQIIEGSDSDGGSSGGRIEEQDDTGGVGALSALAAGLHSSGPPVFGSVAVTDSENVQFGNNTYFHGPVTIKQIIHTNSGIDNAAYNKTEDDNRTEKKLQSKEEQSKEEQSKEEPSVQKFKIQTWLKFVLSAVGVVMISGICAVLIITYGSEVQDLPNAENDDISDGNSSTSICGQVVVLNEVYPVIISIILAALIFLLVFYRLLLTQGTTHTHRNETNVAVASDAHCISQTNKAKEDEATILIAPGHLRIVSRTDWLAQPVEKPLDVMRHPIPWVIITHTATASCFNQSACVLNVRLMQTFHIESRGWYDIGYNFLVGGDGSAYFGRGWDYVGAHTKGYNQYSVGIAFIGTFNNDNPPRRQIEACQKLIRQGVEQGKLARDYKLFAHRQLMSTLSPGDKVYDIIKKWPHFVKNDTDIAELIPDY